MIRSPDTKIVRTVEVVAGSLMLDVDAKGQVVGIEALEPGLLKLPDEARCVDFAKLGQSFRSAAALL